MGVPWEIVVREFRNYPELMSPIDSIDRYADEFFIFLAKFYADYCAVYRHNSVKQSYIDFAEAVIKDVFSPILAKVFNSQYMGGRLDVSDASKMTAGMQDEINGLLMVDLTKRNSAIEKAKFKSVFGGARGGKSFEGRLSKSLDAENKNILSAVLRSFEIDPASINLMSSLIVKYITRDVCDEHMIYEGAGDSCGASGIVFIGYGRKDVFPRMRWYDVGGFVAGEMLGSDYEGAGVVFRRFVSEISIDANVSAAVKAFGDEDVVETFMGGLSSDFQAKFQQSVDRMAPERRQALAKSFDPLEKATQKICREAREQKLVAIADMPRRRLAELAEKMVDLSSIKSHLHDHDGAIGGPVSVAVISRGDGLVWVKRDNYFDPALNAHFFDKSKMD